ncbi:MAG TPA: hypothetical protein VIJ81_08060, partial [Sphingomicrobium sp.]
EELAHLKIADRGCASLRDQLVQIAMSGQHLDRDGLKTILEAQAAGKRSRRCSPAPSRWSNGCGATRWIARRSTRPKRARA